MAKIESGRWSELLRRALGMKGVQTVSAELSPEVSPVWVLEQDLAEWQFLKGVRLVSAASSRALSAGNIARFAVINPVGSAMIASISHLSFSASVNTTLSVRLVQVTLAQFTTLEEAGPRDTRWARGAAATVSPITFSSEDNAAGIAGGFLLYTSQVLANTPVEFGRPIVLAPGSSLFWAGSGAAATRAAVAWSERPLPPLER